MLGRRPRRVSPSLHPVPLGRLVTIGRDSTNSLHLADPGVSRHHAEIRSFNGVVLLRDLESHNGTQVNGERIDVRALHDGDLIQVGHTRLLYQRYPRPTLQLVPLPVLGRNGDAEQSRPEPWQSA